MPNKLIVLHPDDNVATSIDDLAAGETVAWADGEIRLLEAVPYGHKVALRPIARNATILKYGESIGTAATDIPAGGYVHVHNVESQRGRGDRQEQAR
jgi:altronate dehydratase small subunit